MEIYHINLNSYKVSIKVTHECFDKGRIASYKLTTYDTITVRAINEKRAMINARIEWKKRNHSFSVKCLSARLINQKHFDCPPGSVVSIVGTSL